MNPGLAVLAAIGVVAVVFGAVRFYAGRRLRPIRALCSAKGWHFQPGLLSDFAIHGGTWSINYAATDSDGDARFTLDLKVRIRSPLGRLSILSGASLAALRTPAVSAAAAITRLPGPSPVPQHLLGGSPLALPGSLQAAGLVAVGDAGTLQRLESAGVLDALGTLARRGLTLNVHANEIVVSIPMSRLADVVDAVPAMAALADRAQVL